MADNPDTQQDQEQTPRRRGAKKDQTDLPQGQTNPSRDMHSDDDAVVREDVPLSAEIRLTPDAGEDVGEGEIQGFVDQENSVGFRGTASDPTPNEHYTVAGVTAGKPTPETHFGQRRAAKFARTLNEGVESL